MKAKTVGKAAVVGIGALAALGRRPVEIHTEIEIDATPEEVWAALTDFAAHPEWNPFFTEIAGEARTGERLTVRMRAGGRVVTFHPTVMVAEPGRELRWLGHAMGVPGLFDGEHVFTIEPLGPDRARLVQRETFRGALIPLMGKALTDTRASFEAMNRALKTRLETR